MNKAKQGEVKKQRDYQEELTIKFIVRIEEIIASSDNDLKWHKPFFSSSELPWNALTGEKYHGCNIVSLLSEKWTDPRWMTYMQMGELGRKLDKKLHVNRGETASFVMKTIPVYQKDEEGEVIKDFSGKPIPVCYKDGTPKLGYKWYAVFNAGQINGLDPYIQPSKAMQPTEEVELLSAALQERTGLTVVHSARSRAMYQVGQHRVHMPEKHLFESEQGYSDCLLHELGHSTGAALNRDMTGDFGSQKYAFEELVAELCSSFMNIEFGLKHDFSSHENSLAYLKSWLEILKMDKNCLIRASNQASKAADYQMEHLRKYTEENAAKKLSADYLPVVIPSPYVHRPTI